MTHHAPTCPCHTNNQGDHQVTTTPATAELVAVALAGFVAAARAYLAAVDGAALTSNTTTRKA